MARGIQSVWTLYVHQHALQAHNTSTVRAVVPTRYSRARVMLSKLYPVRYPYNICLVQECTGGHYVTVAGTATSDVTCGGTCTVCADSLRPETTACKNGGWDSLGTDAVCGAACVSGAEYFDGTTCRAYTVATSYLSDALDAALTAEEGV